MKEINGEKYLDNIGKEELLKQYNEVKTLSNLAEKLDIGLETLRKYFIKYNIKYNKQIKYDCDHFLFSQDNEKSFYWAGFLAADGNIEKEKPRIKLQLASRDVEHIIKFKNDLKSESPINSWDYSDSRPEFIKDKYFASSIKITSKQIVNDLKRFNVIPNKSKIYEFPIHLLENKNIRHFIRGLIDGDGSISKSENSQHSYIGLCGTKNCIQIVGNIFKNMAEMPEKISISERDDGLWILRSTTIVNNIKIAHYLYDDAKIFLDRKNIEAIEILKCIPGQFSRKIELDKEELLKLFQQYQNENKVAEKLNISKPTLRRRIDELNIRTEINSLYINPNNIMWNILTPQELEEEYLKLGTIVAMAKKYNVSKKCIRNAFARYPNNILDLQRKEDEILDKLILEKYKEIKTIRGVARELNIPRHKVSYLIHNLLKS